jgi:murein DD-endopeptidase MepM/ murein hydrolase activator NlpD
LDFESDIGRMTLHIQTLRKTLDHAQAQSARLIRRGLAGAQRRPAIAATALLVVGMAVGSGMQSAQVAHLQARVEGQDAQLEQTRREAQREVNALAARLGELQAQTNRLNALGDRLTRVAQLGDGEFDFNKPVAVGGAGPVRDMAARELRDGMGQVEGDLRASGDQLSVLEALLFDRELDRNATPSRFPVAKGYITSGFGGRADPFGGGRQYHKGIDFDANTGDTVLSVADGVVSYSGSRSGYGNVVEVDHGNGYVTRYAHNSRLVVKVGDLVRVGQEIAKAGSTGRSTGAHVHFEVWENGRVVNPRKFLGDGKTARRG